MASSTPNSNGMLIAVRVAFVVALLSLSVFVVVEAAKDKHSISAGKATYIDRLLFHNTTKANGKFLRKQTKDLCFPQVVTRRVNITAYNVTDLVPKGKGGYPSRLSGGINATQVCFHLESQRGEGFHFQIDIWGH